MHTDTHKHSHTNSAVVVSFIHYLIRRVIKQAASKKGLSNWVEVSDDVVRKEWGRKSLSIHNYVNYKVKWRTTHAEIISGENWIQILIEPERGGGVGRRISRERVHTTNKSNDSFRHIHTKATKAEENIKSRIFNLQFI